jgi:hypothetical protein
MPKPTLMEILNPHLTGSMIGAGKVFSRLPTSRPKPPLYWRMRKTDECYVTSEIEKDFSMAKTLVDLPDVRNSPLRQMSGATSYFTDVEIEPC